jgi:hypothetical protein
VVASRASFFRGGVLGSLYRLSQLAILRDFRKHGFGRELVLRLALHEWAIADSRSRGKQTVTVFCHSQIPIKSFYARVSATYFSLALLRPFGFCCLASFGHKPEVSIDVVYLFIMWADSNLVILPIFKGNEFIGDDAPF